jgi:dTDP-glucose pyrophosphorylase
MSTAIITMAGFGSRFLKAGYDVPKYRIEAHGRSLFAWSMLSLRSFIAAGHRFVFIVRAADEAAEFIEREAALLGMTSHEVLQLEAPTDGQATTALLAERASIDAGRPALIYNIDTFVHPDALRADAVRGDGWIPCFPAAGDHWSFAAADADGRVSEVREKARISPHATVGLYWFSSFDLYARAYREYYRSGANIEAGERYVAPLYNHLLTAERPVFIQEVGLDAVIPLGTPAEVEAFRARDVPEI